MSHLNDLIAELCPNGVEFKPLGEVGDFVRGIGLQKSDLRESGTPAIHYGQIHTHYGIWTETTKSFIDTSRAVRLRKAEPGNLVIATTSEDDASVAKATAWLGQEPVAVSGDAYIYQHNLDPRYVAYYFNSTPFESQKHKFVTGAKVRRISGSSLAKILIPAPPHEVQHEIVRILDQFTELAAELEAELRCRREQHSATWNNLTLRIQHDPEEPTIKAKLGDVAHEHIEPVNLVADHNYTTLGVKWNGLGVLIRAPRRGDRIKTTRLFRVRPSQLIYNRMFVAEGSFAIVPEECRSAVVSNEFPLFQLDPTKIDPHWLLNFLCDPQTLARIEREATGTERGSMKSRRRWNSKQFADFEVELPSLGTQQAVSRTLRASDDLIQELQNELAARRKQYEYYRDRLLTFTEAPA